MSRPHGLVFSPRCLIVIIKLFSFQSTIIGLLSFLFSILSTNDYATYHRCQPLRSGSDAGGSLSYKSILYESPQFIWTCGSPWLRAEGMLLVLKVYETCDLSVCPARYIFFNFMYILYINFRKISNFQTYLISNWRQF